ncbi:DUF2559 family protein [Alkalimonas delamerensis]|uniref:DUF2559 family protein n=1 Tax=Alkalimonas delamerensis TaxID=265981 RepID=A0ABT9GPW2_9GAMM|nr:YhfG family protein [Alkalimonas delamerensis]MDP4529004.1 DUF2559 family protein [Alkalimonas delamerensis]
MNDKELMARRFEESKVTNFNESLRLEGLQPLNAQTPLHPKVIARLKELQRAHD